MIDPLSAVMAVLITFISLMVAVYSKPFMRKEDWLHIGGYYTLYGLLTVGLAVWSSPAICSICTFI